MIKSKADFKEKMEKLKKNRLAVPEEELQTKYKTAYENLCIEVWELANKVLIETATVNMYMKSDELEKEQKVQIRCMKMMRDEEHKGLRNQMRVAVMEEQDLKKAYRCIDGLAEEMMKIYRQVFDRRNSDGKIN